MKFLSGVVEGFYGTPWREAERLELFQRMNKLDFNTYIYAPKDEVKHRKFWRERYTDTEINALQVLINDAHAQNVDFVYSISPGLDIVFSSPADITSLKEKLQQVYSIGCRSFALLFDDIDPELCLADKIEFPSFGAAQVDVSNKLYDWFKELKTILFCPTEYCFTRAKPSVRESDYLKYLGVHLDKKIHIMWTGPKVVPNIIDVKSIDELAEVLQRKPVIWDNIHANDYDQRRLFLGPCKGLPLKLYKHTAGILKNPNCEYECNFVAFHSMSTWLRIARTQLDEKEEDAQTTNTDDDSLYDSKLALIDAVDNWLEMFHISRDSVEFSKFHANKICWENNSNSSEEVNGNGVADNQQQQQHETTKTDANEKSTENDQKHNENNKSSEVCPEKKPRQSTITSDDVILLCELFYLPYEHGERGCSLLAEFKWLQANAIDYHNKAFSPNIMMVEEWIERSRMFQDSCQCVQNMHERFLEISNKRILEQLIPYIYNVKEAVSHLSKYVKWLGSVERQQGSKFLPEDPEAWFYRGGILGEMERLLPSPGDISNKSNFPLGDSGGVCEQKQLVYLIRPYISDDKDELYNLCRQQSANPDVYTQHLNLAGDCLIGAYLKYSPSNVFILEINGKICGYVSAYCNGKEFYNKVKQDWLPTICKPYRKPDGDPDDWTPEQHMINRLHYPQFYFPDELCSEYEGVFSTRLSTEVLTEELFLQAIKCIKSTLHCNLFLQLKTAQSAKYDKLLSSVGFAKVTSLKPPNDIILYGLKM